MQNPPELFEHHRITVDPGQTALRIDKFLTNRLPNTSRNKVQAAIEAGFVFVNRVAIKPNYRVKPLDEIAIVLPNPPCLRTVQPEDISLDIIYEDDDLLVVNKPLGMVVHPGYNNWTGTLANALVYHFKNLPNKNNVEGRPGLVHRIDKDTSGLLVVAKNEKSMTCLAKQFYDHTVSRTYKALVWGTPKESDATIAANLSKSHKDHRVVVATDSDNLGKRAVTHYKVIKNYLYVTLIECRLETGRTHQIRSHMKYVGHPIFGDTVYGGNNLLKGPQTGSYRAFVQKCFEIMPHQALHASSLGFVHPTSGEKLNFETTLNEKFKDLLDAWEIFLR